ncbi:CoA transferase [Baekduia soli]|uniref:CoA transferase n=1 Tax=Baekduia soli TaxID=496014 RepID=A0A5B8UCM2_9ACTN|nr:CoA transferase [Baekduia soli]
MYNAPYATLLLALGGAHVIKVEPKHGENLRGRTQGAGAGAPFVMLNSNKQGITIDLRTDRGRELLLQLADRADVLVENFRPGVMEKLGAGPDVVRARNPRIIYGSGSGFGHSGPYRDFAAMDLTIQAMAGIMSVTGFPDRPPVKAGPAVADFFGGIHLYGAIVTALFDRERTGEGRTVEASMFESVYPSLMSSLGLFFGAGQGESPMRTGNRHAGLAEAPYNVYPAADGHVAIICVSDAHWRGLAGLLGRPELADHPDYATRRARVERIDEVDELVGAFTSRHDRDPLCALLREHRVPCAPVRELGEVVADEHLHARGMLQEIEHPELGTVTVPHTPLRYDGEERTPLVLAPGLGEHNEAVLLDWLGLDPAEYASLVEQEVI